VTSAQFFTRQAYIDADKQLCDLFHTSAAGPAGDAKTRSRATAAGYHVPNKNAAG
jgi:hypothetical protein